MFIKIRPRGARYRANRGYVKILKLYSNVKEDNQGVLCVM